MECLQVRLFWTFQNIYCSQVSSWNYRNPRHVCSRPRPNQLDRPVCDFPRCCHLRRHEERTVGTAPHVNSFILKFIKIFSSQLIYCFKILLNRFFDSS